MVVRNHDSSKRSPKKVRADRHREQNGIAVHGSRGRGGQHGLTALIGYRTSRRVIHRGGWTHWFKSQCSRALTSWSINGYWGAAWHSCWACCIDTLLPNATRSSSTPLTEITLDKATWRRTLYAWR